MRRRRTLHGVIDRVRRFAITPDQRIGQKAIAMLRTILRAALAAALLSLTPPLAADDRPLPPGAEADIDLPGLDIAATPVPDDPAACFALCAGDPACVAWTFVRPGTPGDTAACWTKFDIPERVESACCVSGILPEGAHAATAPAADPPPAVVPPGADAGGRYRDLLRVLNVPDDAGAYGPFTDFGFFDGTDYAGYSDLPPGYWVYLEPDWYIWGAIALSAFPPEVTDATAQLERTEGGPEADLVIRVGDVDNLGFGFKPGFGLFEGDTTDVHGWPWEPAAEDAPGTDRIMIGTSVRPPAGGDGYHDTAEARVTEAITIPLGDLPVPVTGALLQMFIDDFQAPSQGSRFVIRLNGQVAGAASRLLNAVDQSGPVGKLITLPLPEALELEPGGVLEILVDDPTTGAGDGFAVDFVRLLVNPGPPLRPAAVEGVVLDAETWSPVPGADVTTAGLSVRADAEGRFRLNPVFAGLVLAEATHPAYLPGAAQADVRAGETSVLEIWLSRAGPAECTDLIADLAREGRATLRGVTFATGSAQLTGDSLTVLAGARDLIAATPGNWIVEGHTDNVGARPMNQALSETRAAAVRDWLVGQGIDPGRLTAVGHAFDRPVADNATESGRALNRRVDLVPDGALPARISCTAGAPPDAAPDPAPIREATLPDADPAPPVADGAPETVADAAGAVAEPDPDGPIARQLARIEAVDAVLAGLLDTLPQPAPLAGADPAAVARDLALRVRYLPYQGVLRGAEGLVRSGAGNDLDQALALAAALREAQAGEVRLRAGRLSEADRAALLARIAAPAPDDTAARLLRALATALDLEAPAPDDSVLADLLAPILPLAGEGAGFDVDAIPEAYHWVEWRATGGDWTALHTAFGPDAAPSGLVAGETFAEAVPEALQHRISVLPVAEIDRAGTLERMALAAPWVRPAANMLDLAPQFELINGGQPDRPAWGFRVEGAVLPDALSGLGLLAPPDALATAEGAFIETVGAGFGLGAGALETALTGDDPAGTAVLRIGLEVTLTGPGTATHVETHWWLDADETGPPGADPAAEYRSTFLIVSAGQETQASLAQSDIAAAREGLDRIARILRAARAEGAADLFDLSPERLEAYAAAIGRDFGGTTPVQFYARGVLEHPASPAAGPEWRPAPAALLLTRAPGDARAPSLRTDILRNPRVALAADGAGGWRIDTAAALTGGLRDTLAEAVLLARPSSYADAAAAGHSADPDRFAPRDRAALEADIARGYTVLPLAEAPALWWRLDPARGEVLGRSRLGGSESAEYVGLIEAAYLMVDGVLIWAGTYKSVVECGQQHPAGSAKYQCCMHAAYGEAIVGAAIGVATGGIGGAALAAPGAAGLAAAGSGLGAMLVGITVSVIALVVSPTDLVCS